MILDPDLSPGYPSLSCLSSPVLSGTTTAPQRHDHGTPNCGPLRGTVSMTRSSLGLLAGSPGVGRVPLGQHGSRVIQLRTPGGISGLSLGGVPVEGVRASFSVALCFSGSRPGPRPAWRRSPGPNRGTRSSTWKMSRIICTSC